MNSSELDRLKDAHAEATRLRVAMEQDHKLAAAAERRANRNLQAAINQEQQAALAVRATHPS